jgi:hypothetical protein
MTAKPSNSSDEVSRVNPTMQETHVISIGGVPRPSQMNTRTETLLILAFGLIYGPFLLNKNLYWDDWAFLWVYWVQGPGMLLEYYTQAGHAWHSLPLLLYYWLGGEYAGVLARALAVVSHVGAALLLHRIFLKIESTKNISVWIAALYVLSPFYYARGVMVTTFCDLFLLCYLLSVWVMSSPRLAPNVLALVFFGLSLGYETFMMLEPLRFLFVNEFRKDLYKTVRQCSPVWVLALFFAILRFTWLKPYGAFAGYNALNLDVLNIGKCFVMTILYYPRAIWLITAGSADLVGWYGLAVVAALSLILERVLTYRYSAGLIAGPASVSFTLRRIMIGTTIALLGAIPYILVDRYPAPHNFSSRFAVVSIPGVLLIIVSLIAALRSRFLRTYAFLLFSMVSILFSLQLTKWYLYEAAVKQDLIMQLHQMTSACSAEPTKILVKMVPDSTKILILGKRISICELAVPVNLLRDPAQPLLFLMEKSRDADEEWLGPCTIDQNDRHPCPGKPVTLEYRLKPENASVEKISYLYLLKSVFTTFEEPPELGVLTAPLGPPSADQSDRPVRTKPSIREGGKIAAGILNVGPQFLKDPTTQRKTLGQIRVDPR